ncbi:MAG: hypothetical protein WC758_08080 [Candidatus Woesearchaeota archaeon]|jgi:hypothetical protein
MKTKAIRELKEDFIKAYNKYADKFNDMSKNFEKLNIQLIDLSNEANELLSFLERLSNVAEVKK